TGTVGNNVTATGGGDPDPECSSCTTGHPLTQTPAIAIIKTGVFQDESSDGFAQVGETIVYTFTVTNVGNVTLTNVIVDDNLTGSVGLAVTPSTLAPGAVGTANASYVITQADLDQGSVANQALATGTPPSGPDVTDDSDDDSNFENDPTVIPLFTLPVILATDIAVNKSSDPASGSAVVPGLFIEYTLTAVIENSELTEPLVLQDTLDAGLLFVSITNQGAFQVGSTANPLIFSLPVGTDPGTYQISYNVRVGLNAVDNVGNSVIITGGGGDPTPECQVCSTTHPISDLAISLDKSVELGIDNNDNSVGDVGDILFYEFVITNIGNVPLFDIALLDELVDDLECVPLATDGTLVRVSLGDILFADGFEGTPSVNQPLNPGASLFCTASYTLTPEDINRGNVTNFATVSAVDDDGNIAESTSTAIFDDMLQP
nr:hypothetical protein [Gammaproteobacteria bacterium]